MREVSSSASSSSTSSSLSSSSSSLSSSALFLAVDNKSGELLCAPRTFVHEKDYTSEFKYSSLVLLDLLLVVLMQCMIAGRCGACRDHRCCSVQPLRMTNVRISAPSLSFPIALSAPISLPLLMPMLSHHLHSLSSKSTVSTPSPPPPSPLYSPCVRCRRFQDERWRRLLSDCGQGAQGCVDGGTGERVVV